MNFSSVKNLLFFSCKVLQFHCATQRRVTDITYCKRNATVKCYALHREFSETRPWAGVKRRVFDPALNCPRSMDIERSWIGNGERRGCRTLHCSFLCRRSRQLGLRRRSSADRTAFCSEGRVCRWVPPNGDLRAINADDWNTNVSSKLAWTLDTTMGHSRTQQSLFNPFVHELIMYYLYAIVSQS